jgi:hypothetical protein
MIALVGSLVFLAVDTVVRIRHIEQLSGSYGEMVEPPAVDASSPTGYALGRRSMFYPGGGLDTLHWVMQTQAMFATDAWRLRRLTSGTLQDFLALSDELGVEIPAAQLRRLAAGLVPPLLRPKR